MRVYISSTYEDLKKYRKATHEAIHQLEYHPVGMESDVASDNRPLDVCLKNLASCQVYICIIAWRYGYIHPEHGLSMTELEYREAEKLKIPRLIFFLNDEVKWPRKWVENDHEKFTHFREDASQGYVRKFTNEESLQKEVIAALHWLDRKQQAPSPQNTTKPTPPDLLPFLANRDDQEDALVTALKSINPTKPCVFIVHGDEFQCHDKYLERLRGISFPKLTDLLCGASGKDTPLSQYTILWVNENNPKIGFAARFNASISRKVFGKPDVLPEEINRELTANPGVVMFDTHILSEDCLLNHKLPFEHFLNYWAKWPQLNAGQRLVVILFVKYELKTSAKWLTRLKFKRLNKRIRLHLESLEIANYGLNGAVLPELGNLTRRHCENWVREENVRQFLRGGEAKVRTFFEQWEKKHKNNEVPMETMAEELRQWLLNQ